MSSHTRYTFPLRFVLMFMTLLWLSLSLNTNPAQANADLDGEVLAQEDRAATATRTPTPVSIGNLVWDDLDQDGKQDAGEPGISGVTVQLWNSTKTSVIDSTITNSTGNYTLVAPQPMSVRVRVVLQNINDGFSPKDLGGDDLKDNDFNPTGTSLGFTDVISIASNVISITKIDAGIIKFRTPTPTRTPTPVNIGNLVWDDLDKDGKQDAGEPGISGVTVQLWNSTKTSVIDSTITNSTGNYTLVAPQPMSVRVRVVLPNINDAFSPKNLADGSDTADSDFNPSGSDIGFTDIISIGSNVISISNVDAGLIKFRTPTPTRTPTPVNIGNFVWDDLDEDGQQDAGEPGIAGVTVQLWNTDMNQLLDSDVTDSNGTYFVTAPQPMSVRVRVVLPTVDDAFSPKNMAGGSDTADSDFNPSGSTLGFTDIITIASNVISMSNVDAGLIRGDPITIGNLVWSDKDADGVLEKGEGGVSGITVQLWNSTKTLLIDTTTTNSSGIYSLNGVTGVSYRVRVILPGGVSFSPINQGLSDSTDSDINPTGTNSGYSNLVAFRASTLNLDVGLVNVPNTATPTRTPTLTPMPSLTPLPGVTLTPTPASDTLALFGKEANTFSFVNTLTDPPAPENLNTFASNAPVKGKFVMGDWDGDGQESPAFLNNGSFWYTNSIDPAATWSQVQTNITGTVNLVAGRFDAGFANDCFGVVRLDALNATKGYPMKFTCELGALTPPSGMQTQFLKVNLGGTKPFQFVAGDWDGDGLASVAARRGEKIKWSNIVPTAGDTTLNILQTFGAPRTANGLVVAGDWNNDGIDTFGLFYKSDGAFFWRNDLGLEIAPYLTQTIGLPVGDAVASSWRDTGVTRAPVMLPPVVDNNGGAMELPTALPTVVFEPTLTPLPDYLFTPTPIPTLEEYYPSETPIPDDSTQ